MCAKSSSSARLCPRGLVRSACGGGGECEPLEARKFWFAVRNESSSSLCADTGESAT